MKIEKPTKPMMIITGRHSFQARCNLIKPASNFLFFGFAMPFFTSFAGGCDKKGRLAVRRPFFAFVCLLTP
jgi:hypothetical protein